MAPHYYASNGEDDEFHAVSVADIDINDRDDDRDSVSALDMPPPAHPIPSFQDAFDESILDSTADDQDNANDLNDDAEMRRRKLLQADRYRDVRATRYKQRPDAKYHPFLKLISQIVFGMHLLQQQQAKSNEEVVKILQSHVNDVDSFLERTADDFDVALTDIQERIRYLKLPMEHMDVFEGMLDDKEFRMGLLNGNDKIERIIRRSAQAMNDSMLDVQSGLKSTKELAAYLQRIENVWPAHDIEIGGVLAAMRGNEQGWMRFLQDLQAKGSKLSNALKTLSIVIGEISKLAGAASRRNKPQSQTISLETPPLGNSSPRVRSKFAREPYRKPAKPGAWIDKPLPKEPELPLSRSHSVPLLTRFEKPRAQAPKPGSRGTSGSSNSRSHLQPKQASSGASGDGIVNRTPLRKISDPLRSNPPEVKANHSAARSPIVPTGRSHSQPVNELLKQHSKIRAPENRRPRSRDETPKQRDRANSIPRKPVGSYATAQKLHTRSSTAIEHTPSSSCGGNELPSISGGFSRRLSMKLKNLPPPIKNTGLQETPARPIDSAHCSDRRNSTSSPITSPDGHDEKIPAEFEKDLPPVPYDHSRTPSRLGLFPKDGGPLTPTHAIQQHRNFFPGWTPGRLDPPHVNQTSHQSKPSRRASLRKFFHRKDESGSTLAS